MSVWAVLAAGGRGERLGADLPKAFARLGGRPLLAESLERLDASDWIDAIVAVVPAGWDEPTTYLAEELGLSKLVTAVVGGAERTDSVRNGVAEVGDDALLVLVHDAARPLLTDDVIGRVIAPLGEGWDGAVPGLPLADTIKRVARGAIVDTLDRSALVAVQTPQAFQAEVLRAALADAAPGATDCSSLVAARGGRVTVVPGDRRLLKVTTTEDLALVEDWLRQ